MFPLEKLIGIFTYQLLKAYSIVLSSPGFQTGGGGAIAPPTPVVLTSVIKWAW